MSTAARSGELGAFLRAARERLSPAAVGLPDTGRRRTPGLRRQEVAQLAAVSVDWLIRLEQGRAGTPGSAVLDGIADALRLAPDERTHLHLLARGEAPPVARTPGPVRSSLRLILDSLPWPGYLMDHRYEILARNDAAAALFGADFGTGAASNSARLIFLAPDVRAVQLNWEQIARETVGYLRLTATRYPDDAELARLIAELRSESPEFAAWWDDHTVRERNFGTKVIRHRDVGDIPVAYDMLAAPDGSGQILAVVTPVGPAAARALQTLIVARADRLGATTLRAASA
ncbi:helix-turn-helix transcriptional regulator [Nocardia stercoris]|uniref:XRE family transcriptional regulator n=1 Tax=Nocardia stercoris TaxID=2483361 RepID=A0A3M2LE13_9NOCA|nr:helix-turn-helix transcriptional regulator [Nocardia stercoris]RMI32938.1 XRE family transcriptional regulator [Nocardia stercoris]